MASLQRLKSLQRLRQRLGESAWSLQPQRCLAAAAQPAPVDDYIEVTVDGKPTKVLKGSNVLQACDAAGVDIPRYAPPPSLLGWP
jgi:NADH dehydrogenase (ubiquinone) Fe-S protein 1